ncbi:MAG: CaiB/BaiF CoA transferase family protein, partial [Alphaproteobacteria bacterium]
MPPLQGLRVLDLARVLACPFSAMILAELGAEVIKVEQPGSGDESRSYEPVAERNGQRDSAYFFACNRGKRSVTVNLRHKDGQALVRDLIRHCDAVVENFPTGTLKRYGLDWEALRAINPRLVMLSCTGFGQTGPYAKRKGYDTVFQAMSGLMALTGERGGGPVKPGLPIADLTSGLWITIGLLAALRGRDATGQGAYIDFSMLDGQVALLTSAAARFFALNEVPPRLGTEHPGRVPTASFKCADGRFLHITCSD